MKKNVFFISLFLLLSLSIRHTFTSQGTIVPNPYEHPAVGYARLGLKTFQNHALQTLYSLNDVIAATLTPQVVDHPFQINQTKNKQALINHVKIHWENIKELALSEIDQERIRILQDYMDTIQGHVTPEHEITLLQRYITAFTAIQAHHEHMLNESIRLGLMKLERMHNAASRRYKRIRHLTPTQAEIEAAQQQP